MERGNENVVDELKIETSNHQICINKDRNLRIFINK